MIGRMPKRNSAVKSWRIRIQNSAKDDLRDGYEFYNAQEVGLGDYFYDCLMSDIDALAYYGGGASPVSRLLQGAIFTVSVRDLLQAVRRIHKSLRRSGYAQKSSAK